MNLILDVLYKSGTQEKFYLFVEEYTNENQYEEITKKLYDNLVNIDSIVIKTGQKQYTYLNMKNIERINIT